MLDFGCGMGRLTRAFRNYFDSCHGVDISQEMIKKAQKLNQDVTGLEFTVSNLAGLKSAPEAQYDFIYSSLVFQHLEPNLTQSYIQALLRLLKPNGLFIFQTTDNYLPAHNFTIAEAKNRLLQEGAVNFLREGIESRGVILTRSVRMYSLDEKRVKQTVMKAGGNVFDVKFTNHSSIDSIGDLKFLPSEPTTGWVSKLYYVQKNP